MMRRPWILWAVALACCGGQKSEEPLTYIDARPDPASTDTAEDTGTPEAETETETDADCDTGLPEVTWTHWGEGFFRSFCTACHATGNPNRNGAPIEINFDTLADVRSHAAAVQSAVVDRGTMPVGGGVSEEELYLLTLFLDCGLQP